MKDQCHKHSQGNTAELGGEFKLVTLTSVGRQRAGRKTDVRQFSKGLVCILAAQIGCLWLLTSASQFEYHRTVLGLGVASTLILAFALIKLWLASRK